MDTSIRSAQLTLRSSSVLVFFFCLQLITGVKEGLTSTEIWDYLRALWCAKDLSIIRLTNGCMETAEYQARTHLSGFSLSLSLICHISQLKAITVIWVSTGSWLPVVKRQACCYQPVRRSSLDTVRRLTVSVRWVPCASALPGLRQLVTAFKQTIEILLTLHYGRV